MGSEQLSAAEDTGRSGSYATLLRALTLGAGVVLVIVASAGPAGAHRGEEGTETFQFVRQAIAFIVNTPDDHEATADKITDAIEAPDDQGVDVALVEQADAALAIDEYSNGVDPAQDQAPPALTTWSTKWGKSASGSR